MTFVRGHTAKAAALPAATLTAAVSGAAAIVLAAVLACAAPAVAWADEPQVMHLIMVVVGFDGGDDPDAAVPYDDELDWSAALFGESDSPASYYRDMSDGMFTFAPVDETSEAGVAGNVNGADKVNDGVVHVTLHRPHGAWGAVNVDAAVTRDFAAMVVEALAAAAEFVDFTSYDADGDGTLAEGELAICVCVAGYEAASVDDFRRTDVPLTWSHAGYLAVMGDDREAGGVRFDSYIAIAERFWEEGDPLELAGQEPLGTLYHELGHALGLPDLYAVVTTEGTWDAFSVGALSLMDQGGWQYADDGVGWRNIPTALDAWSRYILGWTTPAIAMRSGDYTVSSQLSSSGYSQLIVPTDRRGEYFIVENRQPEGHDASLEYDYDGTNGVVVWHVDSGTVRRYYYSNKVNDADHHPGVMVENQSGEQEVDLLCYNNADDEPGARMASGISIWIPDEPSRDVVVHVELDDANAAANAARLLEDDMRDILGPEDAIVHDIAWIVREAARA